MGQRTDIWTYLIITGVAVLVWSWAASETQVTRTLASIQVEFAIPDAERWLLAPPSLPVTVTVVGSPRSIRDAEGIRQLSIDVAAAAGPQSVDFLQAIRTHARVEEAGVSVVSVTPLDMTLDVDERVQIPARVRPILPGVQTTGDIEVSPPEVTVTMPGRVRSVFPDDLTVEAFLDRRELDRLEPGIAHTIKDVTLRLPEQFTADPAITIAPQRVQLTFTVRSQIRDLAIETPVRIKIAGAPEDSELVELEPKQLRAVTVSAPVELIEQIESGEALVVAMLHIKSSEKESRITSKPITYFVAMRRDGTGVPIMARVGEDGDEHPIIALTISERSDQ